MNRAPPARGRVVEEDADGAKQRLAVRGGEHWTVAGQLDPEALAFSGFTQSQLEAVPQALANTKRSL